MLKAKIEAKKSRYKITITLENEDELIGYTETKKDATKKLSEMVKELKL